MNLKKQEATEQLYWAIPFIIKTFSLLLLSGVHCHSCHCCHCCVMCYSLMCPQDNERDKKYEDPLKSSVLLKLLVFVTVIHESPNNIIVKFYVILQNGKKQTPHNDCVCVCAHAHVYVYTYNILFGQMHTCVQHRERDVCVEESKVMNCRKHT